MPDVRRPASNIQPWKVWVVTGKKKERLSDALLALHMSGEEGKREYNYYPVKWREPYIGRRRECGWGLYSMLGIEKGDKERMLHQHGRNYAFFDAPMGLFFTMDRDMELGSWLDTGMFIQSVMLAARGAGLETCPQAAFCNYHETVTEHLGVPADQQLVCEDGDRLSRPERHRKCVPHDPDRARVVHDIRRIVGPAPEISGRSGSGRTNAGCQICDCIRLRDCRSACADHAMPCRTCSATRTSSTRPHHR